MTMGSGECGGARPPPFTLLTITYKVAVYALAEWPNTLTLFHLYQYKYTNIDAPKLCAEISNEADRYGEAVF
jgi:hypothetical protein